MKLKLKIFYNWEVSSRRHGLRDDVFNIKKKNVIRIFIVFIAGKYKACEIPHL